MRIPPWLVGLLTVLVVVALWWSLAWDRGGEGAPGASPTGTVPTPAVGPGSAAVTTGDEVGRPEPVGADTRPWDGIDACDDDVLPVTMVPVVEDVRAGGPYDHPQRDGSRFGNVEGYLPDEDRSYYREYTVATPGLHHRGQRRIVTGGRGETDPDVWYYTEDHYESFCEFTP